MKYITGIIMLALIIIVSAFVINFLPDEVKNYIDKSRELVSNDGSDKNVRTGVEMIEGNIAVRLPEDIQLQAGIETVSLEPASYVYEQHTFGEVVNIQPLLAFRSRYNSVLSDKKISESALLTSRQEYDRLQLLHNEASNISERQLLQAKSQWMSDSAQIQAKMQEMEDVRNEAVQIWGKTIVDWALNDSDTFRDIMSGKQALLLITLGSSQELQSGTETILISRNGDREYAQEAFYISPASRTDALSQGETYYFHTPAERLRAGMRLDVWIPVNNIPAQGVYIPESAVIWYVDKPWVYLKKDSETFIRRSLINYREGREGWFVEENLHPGDRIVLHGGQMLLSEELRRSIPDEDDNP